MTMVVVVVLEVGVVSPFGHASHETGHLALMPAFDCDDVIKRAHVSRSRGLPHREVTDGGATQSISVLEQILGCSKGDFSTGHRRITAQP